MVRVVGIQHLALVTGALDRTLRFWAEPQPGAWPAPERLTAAVERRVYPVAGSEYFNRHKK
jgi:hypothetical protein